MIITLLGYGIRCLLLGYGINKMMTLEKKKAVRKRDIETRTRKPEPTE